MAVEAKGDPPAVTRCSAGAGMVADLLVMERISHLAASFRLVACLWKVLTISSCIKQNSPSLWQQLLLHSSPSPPPLLYMYVPSFLPLSLTFSFLFLPPSFLPPSPLLHSPLSLCVVSTPRHGLLVGCLPFMCTHTAKYARNLPFCVC